MRMRDALKYEMCTFQKLRYEMFISICLLSVVNRKRAWAKHYEAKTHKQRHTNVHVRCTKKQRNVILCDMSPIICDIM